MNFLIIVQLYCQFIYYDIFIVIIYLHKTSKKKLHKKRIKKHPDMW